MRQGLNKLTAILLIALMLLAVLPVSALGTEQYSDPVMPGISLTSILPGGRNVLTYVFYNGANVATQRVKDGEILVEPEAPDAGEGKAFSGWYTENGEKFTAFGAQTVTATATVNLYARFVDAYYIYFHKPDGSIVHTEVVTDHASHDFSGISYEIADVTKGVIGWASTPDGTEDVSQSISVPEGQTSVHLYAIIGEGYYVTFETGAGTVIAPRFVKNGETLSLNTVANPTLFGYKFGGWYTDEECTIPAGETISSKTTLFAKWNPMDANLTVVFWYENANDEEYSFAGSASVNAKTGAQVSSADYQNHNFTGPDATTGPDAKHFTYNSAKAETVTVKGDGSTVLNVYYTRNTYTLTFKDNYKVYKTISDKYQADIHSNFPIKSGEKTIWWNVPNGCQSFKPGTQLGSIDIMPGENITFTMDEAQSGADLYYYIETLAGETGTYTHGGKSFKLYKQITLNKKCRLTYSEEFHNITGFTQWWSDPKFDKMEQGGVAYAGYHDGGWFGESYYYINEQNYLCYTRNSYDLKFYNYNGYIKQKSVQYETPLKDDNFEPSRPSGLDEDVQYTFGGWYTTSECYVGSEFEWEKATMPASDVILYAKWIPRKYTVSFGLGYETSEAAPETQMVDAKTTAEKPADPVRDDYTFIGWYDTDESGNQLSETPFNFDTRITKNMHLVAHWTTDRTFQLRYDANKLNGGVGNVPVDNNRYADGSKASILDKGNLSNTDEKKVFLGWSTNKDATTADYQPGEAKEIKADEAVNGVITLYAVWGPKPKTTTLIYNANYGPDPMTVNHLLENGSDILPNNATVTLYGEKETKFTRSGYKLIGWAKTADASEPDYSLGQSVIVDTVDTDEGKNVLYAVWEKSTITLTVTKNVTGGLGDKRKDFVIIATANDVTLKRLQLSDGASNTIDNFVIGTALTLTEVAPGSGYEVSAKYSYINEQGNPITNTVSAIQNGDNWVINFAADVLSHNGTITITNRKEAQPDTGVLLDSLPYILIIACVAAIGAFIVIRRRKNRED